MANRTVLGLLALICPSALVGCAVMESQAVLDTGPDVKPVSNPVPDGIPYFLPRRPFVITVSEPNGGGVPMITVTPGAAEPELSKRYVLAQGINLVADNEFNISVGANGLLKSSTSTATSEVATTIQNAAATAGMLVPGGAALNPTALVARLAEVKGNFFGNPAPSPPPLPGPNIACPAAGSSYQVILYPEVPYPPDIPLTLCSDKKDEQGPYTVTWRRADLLPGATAHFGGDSGDSRLARTSTPVSGIFFRHELPYLVTIKGGNKQPRTETDTVITSPDESETNFFPVKRSFFANNTANITITEGVITGVDQTTKSELAAAVGLPATFISSYMSAIGQLFSGFSTVSADQQKLIQQVLSMSATQNQASVVTAVQNQVCAKTVAGYNFSTMNQTDIATALSVIKTACPGS
jgi:hypothetical protein